MIWVVASLVAIGMSWLGIAVVRYNLKRRAARLAAASISEDRCEEVFQLIEDIGTAPSKGSIGIFSSRPRPPGTLHVKLPNHIESFAWAGMVVIVSVKAEQSGWSISFDLSTADAAISEARKEHVRWLKVPAKFHGNKGRSASIYSVDRYLHFSEELRIQANALHPEDPGLMMAYLLSVDGHYPNAEPFSSLRCGLHPAWIQGPRFHKCTICSRTMRLVLQVPGFLLGGRQSDGCFYLFGCQSHPNETATDEDWD
jgi:hypothetical protein